MIKLITVSLVIFYLIYKINSDHALSALSQYSSYHIDLIGIAAFLVILNWGFESKKWQLLVKNISNLSFVDSYKSVLAGLSIGILTPNRIGNFIGRLAWIDKNLHNQATVNTMLGNLAQFIITIVFGLLGLMMVLFYQFPINHKWIIMIFALVLVAIALSLYFKPSLINKTFLIRFLSSKSIDSINEIEKKPITFKGYILGLSCLRYFTFLIQYELLFLAFNMNKDVVLMLSLISTVYLLTTLIPSVFFGKLFVRESVAVFVFSFIGVETSLILLVAFLLWLINLAIPAIIGGLIWLNKSKK